MQKNFKNINRFNFLDDTETTTSKKVKQNKNSENTKNNFKYYDKCITNNKDDNIYNNVVQNKNRETKNYDDILEFPKILNAKNSSNKINLNENNKNLYKNLFEKKQVEEDEEKNIEKKYIPNGHVEISYDNNNRMNIIYNYGNIKSNNHYDSHNKILNKLSNNFFDWRKKYIEMWGEDEYIKIFRFSNYDYDYFNKLDYKYEIEIEKLNDIDEQEQDNDIFDDDKYYDLDYMKY